MQTNTYFDAAAVSTTVVTLMWERSSLAQSYFLYRDSSILVYSGADTYAEDKTVQVGTTYSYQLKILYQDSTLSLLSDPLIYQAATVASGGFECGGTSGVVRLDGYDNNLQREWVIWPSSTSGMLLNVSYM